ASFIAEVGMFDVGTELGLGVLIPLFDNPVEDVGFVSQFSLVGRFVWDELEVGLRVLGVIEYLGPGDFSARSQFSIAPEVLVHLGPDGFLVFRGMFPVDDAASILSEPIYCDP